MSIDLKQLSFVCAHASKSHTIKNPDRFYSQVQINFQLFCRYFVLSRPPFFNIMSRTYLACCLDATTARLLNYHEAERDPCHGYRVLPVLYRTPHRPAASHLLPAMFNPYHDFLLRHHHCRGFHVNGVTMLKRGDLPNWYAAWEFGSSNVLIIH